MSWELNGVSDMRRVAVVATTLCLAAASSLAQSADPSPPSLSELARLVAHRRRRHAAFIEGDFAGDGRLFRLRHAYGQWKSLVIGQTWSTFADPEAEPDGIDSEGLNAIALFRQPLVRFTKPLGARFSLATAVENPATSRTPGA